MTLSIKLTFLATVVLSTCFSGCTNAAKILFLCDEVKSHVGKFSSIADELIKRGHSVYWLLNEHLQVPSNFRSSKSHVFRYLHRDLELDWEDFYDGLTRLAMERPGDVKHLLSTIELVMDQVSRIVLTENEEVMKEIMEVGIDLAVIDGVFLSQYKYLIAHRLGVPIVTVSSALYTPWTNRIPWLPSFVPLALVPLSDRLNFMERLQNTFFYCVMHFLASGSKVSQDITEKYQQYGHIDSPDDVMMKTELWVIETDPLLDYPRPRMPNMIEAGGLTTKPAKPLPEDWKKILRNSPHGVVLVSFGSIASNFPLQTSKKLLTAFKDMPQTVIFRFKNKDNLPIPSNVHISDWIPQNDLLADSKIKVFITHCGTNGQYEALYHGVPMVGLPILGDQFHNAKRMVNKGYGLQVDFFTFEPHELVNATQEIIANQKYSSLIKRASMIFHDRPDTPAERAASGVELILKYGGMHLKSSALDMPLYQFLMLDILLSFCVVLVILMCIIKYSLGRLFKFCFPRRMCQQKLKAQ